MKLDILAFGAHPDDVEISAGGLLIAEAIKGKKVGIVDLTLGELGTRGTVEMRKQEAQDAAQIIGCAVRENLEMKDGFFENNQANQLRVIEILRKYQPDVVLCNAPSDRHPDHGRASELVKESCFLSGLRKIVTGDLEAWRPNVVYAYMQFYHFNPDFIYDISDVIELKMKSIKAHKSQFFNPKSNEPQTLIASEHFLNNIQYRASEYGIQAGFAYGEAFKTFRMPGIKNIFDLY